MKAMFVTLCLAAALASPAGAGDPVVVLQESRTPVPSALAPGDTATLSLPTPVLESARKTRYRFQYGGGSQPHQRPRPRRGMRDPARRRRPNPLDLAPA